MSNSIKEIVHHYRVYQEGTFPMRTLRKYSLTPYVDPRGGYTEVEWVDEDGNTLARGQAFCSRLDNYNKKRGRQIAAGRARKALELHMGMRVSA